MINKDLLFKIGCYFLCLTISQTFTVTRNRFELISLKQNFLKYDSNNLKSSQLRLNCQLHNENSPEYKRTMVEDDQQKVLVSYAALALVPIIWGSYTPIVKDLYSTGGITPPPLAFNLLSYIISWLSLLLFNTFSQFYKQRQDDSSSTSSLSSSQNITNTNLENLAGLELGCWLFAGSSLQVD